ncbi:MAG: hypothetical protein L0J79_08725, partial [Propionibacterium sp.]|nr:hypothetical protein [Propionibacterium sp.]
MASQGLALGTQLVDVGTGQRHDDPGGATEFDRRFTTPDPRRSHLAQRTRLAGSRSSTPLRPCDIPVSVTVTMTATLTATVHVP